MLCASMQALELLTGGVVQPEQPLVHVADAVPRWVTLTVQFKKVPGSDRWGRGRGEKRDRGEAGVL